MEIKLSRLIKIINEEIEISIIKEADEQLQIEDGSPEPFHGKPADDEWSKKRVYVVEEEEEDLEEKKQPSEKAAKKAERVLRKTAKKKFPKDKERQDRYIYGGKRNIGWKPKSERK